MRIDQITDLEQMRQLAQLLEAKNTRLHKRLEALVTQLAALQGKCGSPTISIARAALAGSTDGPVER